MIFVDMVDRHCSGVSPNPVKSRPVRVEPDEKPDWKFEFIRIIWTS
jgi:hypothetical protein